MGVSVPIDPIGSAPARAIGSTMIEAGDALSLGALFDPSASHDLSLQLLLAGSTGYACTCRAWIYCAWIYCAC